MAQSHWTELSWLWINITWGYRAFHSKHWSILEVFCPQISAELWNSFCVFYNLFCIFKRIDPIYRVYSPPQSLPNSDFHKEDCSRIHLRREKKEMQVSGQAELEVHLLYWRCFMLLWLCCNSNCVYCWLFHFTFPTVPLFWHEMKDLWGLSWKIGLFGFFFFSKLDIDSPWLHSLRKIQISNDLNWGKKEK